MIYLTHLAIACLLLAGCSDIVTNKYQTRRDAKSDLLFERGWLPDVIPQSSNRITTSNDVDLNISQGEFFFEISETKSFIGRLSPYSISKTPFEGFEKSVTEARLKGYIPYQYVDNDTCWVFFVDSNNGHCEYVMWMSDKNSQLGGSP